MQNLFLVQNDVNIRVDFFDCKPSTIPESDSPAMGFNLVQTFSSNNMGSDTFGACRVERNTNIICESAFSSPAILNM